MSKQSANYVKRSGKNLTKRKKSPENKSLPATVLKCIVWQIAVCAVGIFLCCIALNNFTDPDKYIAPAAAICACLSGLAGGVIFKKSNREASCSLAMVAGGAFTALMFCVSLLFDKNQVDSSPLFKIVLATLPVVFAFCGGKIASKPKKSRKM